MPIPPLRDPQEEARCAGVRGLVEAVARATQGKEGLLGSAGFMTTVEDLTLLRSDQVRSPRVVLYARRYTWCFRVRTGRLRRPTTELRAGRGLVRRHRHPPSPLGRVTVVSETEPYLRLVTQFHIVTLEDCWRQSSPPAKGVELMGEGNFRVDFGNELTDCARRMIGLLDTLRSIPMLSPATLREIGYRLLPGSHGDAAGRIARRCGAREEWPSRSTFCGSVGRNQCRHSRAVKREAHSIDDFAGNHVAAIRV